MTPCTFVATSYGGTSCSPIRDLGQSAGNFPVDYITPLAEATYLQINTRSAPITRKCSARYDDYSPHNDMEETEHILTQNNISAQKNRQLQDLHGPYLERGNAVYLRDEAQSALSISDLKIALVLRTFRYLILLFTNYPP